MSDDNGYDLAKKIAQRATENYDPFYRVEVRGPLEGNVVFSDGSIYNFKEGIAMVHRRNLSEAYNLGCKRTSRRRRVSP